MLEWGGSVLTRLLKWTIHQGATCEKENAVTLVISAKEKELQGELVKNTLGMLSTSYTNA